MGGGFGNFGGNHFNPRPPARGGDTGTESLYTRIDISIHAPREGGDSPHPACHPQAAPYFNPRPPRGGATSTP